MDVFAWDVARDIIYDNGTLVVDEGELKTLFTSARAGDSHSHMLLRFVADFQAEWLGVGLPLTPRSLPFPPHPTLALVFLSWIIVLVSGSFGPHMRGRVFLFVSMAGVACTIEPSLSDPHTNLHKTFGPLTHARTAG